MQNFMMHDMKQILDPKDVTFWVWGLKLILDPKDSFNQKSRTLAPIFRNRTWFTQNKMNQIKLWNLIKFLDLGVWGLETTFGPFGAKKTCQAISPIPNLQFSQTGPHFLWNHEMNRIKLWNLTTFFDLGVWGLEITFKLLGLKKCILP